ncbi:MAG: hypothetical protein PWP59_2208 [Sphaerochaeta sp.]|nr:hypothetical protein [Sphaerochaeta sp.]
MLQGNQEKRHPPIQCIYLVFRELPTVLHIPSQILRSTCFVEEHVQFYKIEILLQSYCITPYIFGPLNSGTSS